jgi:hypothetical protein
MGMFKLRTRPMVDRARNTELIKFVNGLRRPGANHETTAIAMWTVATATTNLSVKHVNIIRNIGA